MGGQIGGLLQLRADMHRQAALRLQLAQAAIGHFAAVFHHHNAVGVAVELGQRVCAQQHGGAFAAQFFHNAVKHLPRSRIQPGGGLVKQQHFGRAQERLRQGQPLAHAF